MKLPGAFDPSSNSDITLQLLLLGLFLTAYVVAIGGLFGARGRSRACLVATLAAVGFCALTAPWMQGAMVIAGCVAGVGLFSVLAMLASQPLGAELVLLPVVAVGDEAGAAELASAPATGAALLAPSATSATNALRPSP